MFYVHIFRIYNHSNFLVAKYYGTTRRPRERLNEHSSKLKKNCHPNSNLQEAFNHTKYAKFDFEIIFTSSNKKTAHKYQTRMTSDHPLCCNKRIIADSNKGLNHSQNAKRKISAKLMGRNTRSANAIQRSAEKLRGRKKPDHVIKAAQAGLKRWRSDQKNINNAARKLAKLTDKDVRLIRLSTEPYSKLANKYNVSTSVICRIRQRKKYRWVK